MPCDFNSPIAYFFDRIPPNKKHYWLLSLMRRSDHCIQVTESDTKEQESFVRGPLHCAALLSVMVSQLIEISLYTFKLHQFEFLRHTMHTGWLNVQCILTMENFVSGRWRWALFVHWPLRRWLRLRWDGFTGNSPPPPSKHTHTLLTYSPSAGKLFPILLP